MANPAWSAFDKSVAQSQSLADMLDIINSGRRQSVDKTTGIFRPKPLNEAHGLARKELQNEFLVEHGGRTFNLAPTAKPVIQLQNGKVVEWPKEMMHRMPEGSRVLNKSAAEIETMLPPMPKAGSAESSVAAEFPAGAAKWSAAGPTAVVGGGATYGALTGQNPMAAMYGAKAPVPEADQTAMPAKAEDVLKEGGFSRAQMTPAQMLEAARGLSQRPPVDEVESQYVNMGRAAPFGGDYNDVFNVPYAPDYNDQSAVPNPQRILTPTERTALAPARRAPTPDVPARNAVPAGPQPTDAGKSSFFSNLFKDPYAGMSSEKLMGMANRDPDNAAAFFRADEALRRERPEMFAKKQEDQGMATGGTAKPSKEAALHKALEIIHSLIGRR